MISDEAGEFSEFFFIVTKWDSAVCVITNVSKQIFRLAVSFDCSTCSFSQQTTFNDLFSGVLRNPEKLEEGPGGWGFARVFSFLREPAGLILEGAGR